MPPGYPPPGYPVPPGYQPLPGYPPPPPGYPPQFHRYPLPPPPPVRVGGAPLAEAWERLVAYLIDSAVVFGVMLVPIVATLAILLPKILDAFRVEPGQFPDFGTLYLAEGIFLAVALPLQIVVGYCYHVIYMHRTGQTLGKRIMKIRVTRTDGAVFDRRSARRRWAIQYLGTFLPGFNYADILWLLWDQPYRQCLHDKGAYTVVVKVDTA